MNFGKVIEKGLKGMGTVVISILVASIPQIQDYIIGLIPEDIAQLTIAGVVGLILTAVANWLKHLKTS